MFKSNAAFTLLELLIALAFLTIVAFTVVAAVNPAERANQERDERLLRSAEKIAVSIESFFIKEGRYPWSDDLGLDNPASAIAWTSVKSGAIGLCGDKDCQEEGEIENDDFLVAKGVSDAPLYVCFAPFSRENKDKTGPLIRISPGSDLPPSGMPEECPSTVTWKGEDVCYLCVKR